MGVGPGPAPWVAAWDIGGTHRRVALLGPDGRWRGGGKRPLPGRRDVGSAVEACLADLAALEREAGVRVARLGIAVPGPVDPASGRLTGAVNLGWQGADLAAQVRRHRPDLTVWVEDDARCAAWGEAHAPGAPPARHLAVVSVGTGLGMGLILEGRLQRGAHGAAGEVGHLVVAPRGAPCRCGRRGCLETEVSGPGVLRRAREEGADWPDLGEGLRRLAEGARPGARAVRTAGALLGRVLGTLGCALDLAEIRIGGGAGLALYPRWEGPLRRGMARTWGEEAAAQVRLGPARRGEEAGLYGAALLARDGGVGAGD